MAISMLIRLICITAILFLPALSTASDNLFPPADYLRSKLQQNDIVFLGTTHKKSEILKFIAELIPTLEKYDVSHVGLEIPSDQQEKIDVFMKTGNGLDDIKLHTQIESPEYQLITRFGKFRMTKMISIHHYNPYPLESLSYLG
jgi:hypothetical protein